MSQTESGIEIHWKQYERLIAPQINLPTPGELFDYQLRVLVEQGLGRHEDLYPLRHRREAFFLLVPPPPTALDLDALMAKVRVNGKPGQNSLEANVLLDFNEYPKTACVLVDVDDGAERMDTKPS